MTIPFLPAATNQSKPSRAEQRLLKALIRRGLQPFTDEGIALYALSSDQQKICIRMACSPRLTIGGLAYVPDFLFWADSDSAAGPAHVIVEIDGRQWHDTNEGAARDRARDRAFVAAGAYVVRFTTEEIHGDVERCVDELWTIFRMHTARWWSAIQARESAKDHVWGLEIKSDNAWSDGYAEGLRDAKATAEASKQDAEHLADCLTDWAEVMPARTAE
jgi:hypothetical protein